MRFRFSKPTHSSERMTNVNNQQKQKERNAHASFLFPTKFDVVRGFCARHHFIKQLLGLMIQFSI